MQEARYIECPTGKIELIREETYRDIDAIHFSGLKAFAKCPRYFFEKYVEKTLIEPDRDYFLYGSLVDAIVTQPDSVPARFVQVSRRSDVSTLDLEMKINELEAELVPIREKAGAGNKTAMKGVESRENKILELRAQIRESKENGDKEQVPTAIWNDAHETAAAIIALPTLKEFLDQGFELIPQPTLRQKLKKYKRKGRLDFLLLKGDMCVIIDVKTTYKLVDLDPGMYAGQLAFYRELARSVGLRVIGVFALVGDKMKEQKLAQDFLYVSETLDFALENVLAVEQTFLLAREKNEWPSAKTIRGRAQECFACSHCKTRPFSVDKPFFV